MHCLERGIGWVIANTACLFPFYDFKDQLRSTFYSSFLIILIVSLSDATQEHKWHGEGPPANSPCPEELVSIEAKPDCPLQIKLFEASCKEGTNKVWMHYEIKNLTPTPVQGFTLRTVETYEEYESEGQGGRAKGIQLEPGGIMKIWLTCTGVMPRWVRDPGRLKSVVLKVLEVEMADGTTWKHPEIKGRR